jgi:hypothetical protein
MFTHIENQQILWSVIQKSPFFIESRVTNREAWFQDTFSRFYRENPLQPRTKFELLEANKAALQYLTEDLKRQLGYKRETLAIEMSLHPTYNVEEEKKAKEEREKAAYANFQSQYHMLLQTPKPTTMRLTEQSDEKIKNMDELIQQQIRQREMDIAVFASQNKSVAEVSEVPTKKIRILETEDISQEIASIIQQASVEETPNTKTVNWAQGTKQEQEISI